MLNPRQKRFAEAYHLSGNATQSYAEVYGVDEESARRLGSRLLTNVDIMAAIEALQEGTALQCELTREDVITKLCETIQAKPSEAGFENPLCELVMTKAGPAALFPSKIGALKELIRLTGMAAPKKLEVTADDEVKDMLRRLTGAKGEE